MNGDADAQEASRPAGVSPAIPPVTAAITKIDSGAATPSDKSTADGTLSAAQWERLSGQRDVLIKAMVGVFTWLNGGVYLLTYVFTGYGHCHPLRPSDRHPRDLK